LMAGGAIFGIIAAILRLTAVGAPIRFMAIGEKFQLDYTKTGEAFLSQGKPEPWFEGITGQGIGLAMFIGLALACALLAIVGANWALREEEQAEQQDSA
jgi:hypothetical protein